MLNNSESFLHTTADVQTTKQQEMNMIETTKPAPKQDLDTQKQGVVWFGWNNGLCIIR